jgi:hypothetical protein
LQKLFEKDMQQNWAGDNRKVKKCDIELKRKCKRNAMHQNEIKKQKSYEGPEREVPCIENKYMWWQIDGSVRGMSSVERGIMHKSKWKYCRRKKVKIRKITCT